MRLASLGHVFLFLLTLTLAGCGRTMTDMVVDPFGLGLLGLIHLAFAVAALVSIAQSRATTGKKLLWSLLVWLLPVLGLLIWFVAGPKR